MEKLEKSWKKTLLERHGKVVENLLKIGSHEILLRAERIKKKIISSTKSNNLANKIGFNTLPS